MKRDIDLYLSDILESIDVIKARTEDLSEDDFKKNGEKHESVVYRLATIGEAVNKLPKSELSKYKDVHWPGIISMRNILIHEYYEIDLDIIWDTVQNDLDKLKEIITAISNS